jgi:hypothetical protein
MKISENISRKKIKKFVLIERILTISTNIILKLTQSAIFCNKKKTNTTHM